MLLKLCPIEWGFFMNIKFLVLVFIGIFFSCLGLSKLANFYFEISSDYLTATATFFAAFVALYLYNDWKDPFLIEKIESNHKDLRKSIRSFKHSMVHFLSLICYENSESKLNNGDEYSLNYKKRLNVVLDEIDDLASLIKNYESIIMIQKENLALNHLSSISDAEKTLKNIFDVFSKYDLNKDYVESYYYVKNYSLSDQFITDIKAITETFHDNLSIYFREYLQQPKGH